PLSNPTPRDRAPLSLLERTRRRPLLHDELERGRVGVWRRIRIRAHRGLRLPGQRVTRRVCPATGVVSMMNSRATAVFLCAMFFAGCASESDASDPEESELAEDEAALVTEHIAIARGGHGFVRSGSNKRFVPYGFNYV